MDKTIEGSRVATVNSSQATVAVWRYQREEPLPKGKDGSSGLAAR